MKHLRITSHRLFHLLCLLASITLPSGIANATPAPETKTALFAAG